MQEEDILAVFNKQLVEDRRIVVSRSNLNEILKVHRSRFDSQWTQFVMFFIIIDFENLSPRPLKKTSYYAQTCTK